MSDPPAMGAFEHPWLGGLFGDREIARILSAEAEMQRMLRIEAAWARALGQSGGANPDAAERVACHIESAALVPADFRDGMARDGVPVPALVSRLREDAAVKDRDLVHTGLTSQDVVDTALMLALTEILPCFDARLDRLETGFRDLAKRQGSRKLMAITRMQPALPIPVQAQIESWSLPVSEERAALRALAPKLSVIQWGGPVGLRSGTPDRGRAFADALGLTDPGRAWHSDRGRITALGGGLSGLTGALGKFGQDVALLALTGAVKLAGGGASSSMPHKVNPVAAELLVTLASFNATSLAGLHQARVHEGQRSGSAWALEWLHLPGMLMATGRSLTAAQGLLDQIELIGDAP